MGVRQKRQVADGTFFENSVKTLPLLLALVGFVKWWGFLLSACTTTALRQLHDIPEWWGTAVNVQAMVFGNMGKDCATGVAFTRDPSTGRNYFYGEFLVNAQGEDVVAGIRTPQELTIQARRSHGSDLPSLEEVMPNIFRELLSVRSQLEAHYKDMQDIEFTIQQGKLYMLQTRNGKRTAPAALQIAADMANEGLITKEQALLSLKPDLIDQLLHPTLDPKAKKDIIPRWNCQHGE